MAVRVTPRIIALHPPHSLILEIAATGYTGISWLINETDMHEFSRLTLEQNNMKLTLTDTVITDVGKYEADVHMFDGSVDIIDFVVKTYGEP